MPKKSRFSQKSTISWLPYDETSSQAFRLSQVRKLLGSATTYLSSFKVIGLIVLYIIGTRLAIPGSNSELAKEIVRDSDLILFWDTFFSGGAVRNASPLSLGLIPLLLSMFPHRFKRSTDPNYEYSVWSRNNLLVSLVISMVFATFWVWSEVFAPNRIIEFLLSAFTLFLGSIFVAWVDKRLLGYGIFGLLSINVVIASGQFYYSALQSNISGALLSLIFIAFVSFVILYINRRRREIHIVNIQSETTYNSSIYIYWSDFKMGLVYLLILFFTSAPILFSLDIILDAESFLIAQYIVIAFASIAIAILGIRFKILDIFMTIYSPASTSQLLRRNFWVIPGYRPGVATSAYIYGLTHKTHKQHYFAYAALTVLLCSIGIVSNVLDFNTPYLLGPIGTLVIAVVFASTLQIIIERLNSLVLSLTYSEFWVRPSLSKNNQISLENLKVEEIVEYLLRLLPAEDRLELQMKIMLGQNRQDIIRSLFKLARKKVYVQSPGLIVLTIATKILGTVLVSSVGVVLLLPIIETLIGRPISHDDRLEFIFFWIPTFLGLLGSFGIIEDLRDLYGLVVKRDQQQAVLNDYLILEDEDIINDLIRRITVDERETMGISEDKQETVVQTDLKSKSDLPDQNEPVLFGQPPRTNDIQENKTSDTAGTQNETNIPQIHIPETHFNTFRFDFTNRKLHFQLTRTQNPFEDLSRSGKDGSIAVLEAIATYYGYQISVEDVKDSIHPNTNIEDAISSLNKVKSYLASLDLVADIFDAQTSTVLQALCSTEIPVVVLLGSKITKSRVIRFGHNGTLTISHSGDPDPLSPEWIPSYVIIDGYSEPRRYFSILSPFNNLSGTISFERFNDLWAQINRVSLVVYERDKKAKVKEAIRIAEEAQNDDENHDNSSVSELRFYYWYNLGIERLKSNDFAVAREAFDKALALDAPPSLIYSLPSIFDAYIEIGDYAQVLKIANHVLKTYPHSSWAHYYRGVAYLESATVNKAIASFMEAIKYDPTNPSAKNKLEELQSRST